MLEALSFDAAADAAQRWADALLDAGALSVDVADSHAGTPAETPLYAEPGGSGTPFWPVSRLTALNSGIVRAFIPGTECQQVLDRHRRWASEVGELRLGDDDQDPSVSIVLSGIVLLFTSTVTASLAAAAFASSGPFDFPAARTGAILAGIRDAFFL